MISVLGTRLGGNDGMENDRQNRADTRGFDWLMRTLAAQALSHLDTVREH
jgi:hypothetical protein